MTWDFELSAIRAHQERNKQWSTAYYKAIGCHVSIVRYDHTRDTYLCNAGYSNVWVPARDLSAFQ